MSMYFYDETDDWPEYKVVRDQIQQLEQEHLSCRKSLAAAERVLESDTGDADAGARVATLKKRLETIEKKLDASLGMYR